MNTVNIVDMRKRPPHKLDVMATSVYGDESPNLFREGKYYEKGNLVYSYDTTTGDIDVWECQKPGIYGRPAEPSWSQWSMSDMRIRLRNIEDLINSQKDVYEIHDYERSYYLQDVDVRDWENRGSFIECFNDNKYLAKSHYIIDEDEHIVTSDKTKPLPDERKTLVYLNKSANKLTNLVRRVELYGTVDKEGRIKIPYPLKDMNIASSYFYDLYIDGVYISQNFIETVKDDNGNRCAVVSFDDMPISQELQYKIDDGELSVIKPLDIIDETSECVFIYYISISHDLELKKVDYDTFIGYEKDRKWFDISDLNYTGVYQEINVFNNGIKMRPRTYVIDQNRVSVDDPTDRFLLGSVATVSKRSFSPIVEDVVPTVKEETVPIIGSSKLVPIPFLNYDENDDHFLVFNDGGILLGNQRWFEDNGYINIYDDNEMPSPNEMIDFRMISRDQNMKVTTYVITTIEDNQITYEMPVKLRDIYFHMLFTESGQFISRTKYAISGKILQFRPNYANMLKDERFELICFEYVGDYGFTKMTNYKSLWDPTYAKQVVDTLADTETESSAPDDSETESQGPQYEEGAWENMVKNEEGTTLKYIPSEEPGTRCTLIQDTATITLKPAIREETGKPITESVVSYVLGVDADNQIICSTYEGDILRFDREGNEDTRYALKRVTNGTIQILETDDFGNTYFKPYASASGNADVVKIDRYGNQCWSMRETNEGTEDFYCANVYSLKYISGWLYVEYCPHGVTERTMGKINADTGKFYSLNLEIPENKYSFSGSISTLNGNKIYIGSEGHVIFEYEQNGMFSRKLTDLVEDFTVSSITKVYCNGDSVYGVCTDYNTQSDSLLKYSIEGDLQYIKDYGCEIDITFDVDGDIYVFESIYYTISKLDKDTGDVIWSHVLSDSVSNFNNFFVDPVDYHVYAYYVNNNATDVLRYTELEQNGLPIPKYRHELVFNGDQNVTSTDLIGSSLREINFLSSPNNRLYIGTQDGSVYTFTQRMAEMSKKRTVKLWNESNPDIPRYIIPDSDFNFYVITENIVEKWNRYERKLWRYDGRKTMTSILDTIVLNPVTSDLVFLYGDTEGRHSLGLLTEDGDFEQLSITLPNGVTVEDADCAIACDENGNYLFGYSGSTIYAYTKDFKLGNKFCFGIDTDIVSGGKVGHIVVHNSNIYATIKNENDDNVCAKLIKYASSGIKQWEHDFMGSSKYGSLFVDKDGNIYAIDSSEIRKLDPNGNYIWRFKYDKENIGIEPKYVVMDEFYRVFFVDSDYSLHRLDQYDLTLNPIPDEDPEPLEPTDPTPITPPSEDGYIWVQDRFDIPFEFDSTTSSMMLFTNTGQYIGKRFYDIYKDQIVLNGTPIYEDGWLDIVLIENVKESIVL